MLLLTELRVLRLAKAAAFPVRKWDLASKEDLRKELLVMLHVGWHYQPPGTRGPLTPGRRQVHGVPFTRIFSDWAKFLSAGLGEREQTIKTEVAA